MSPFSPYMFPCCLKPYHVSSFPYCALCALRLRLPIRSAASPLSRPSPIDGVGWNRHAHPAPRRDALHQPRAPEGRATSAPRPGGTRYISPAPVPTGGHGSGVPTYSTAPVPAVGHGSGVPSAPPTPAPRAPEGRATSAAPRRDALRRCFALYALRFPLKSCSPALRSSCRSRLMVATLT